MQRKKLKSLCFSIFDIDDFKKINDSYGHDAGDEVLKHITQLMKRELGEYDICRWGGEEIVILLRDSDLYAVKDKMETLRKINSCTALTS